MPDTRTHRGPAPEDSTLFAPAMVDNLRRAVADYSLLLTKGYAEKSALKLVCDRFSLTARQRLAVMRSACSTQKLTSRKKRQISIEQTAGEAVAIDGYNLLITIEAAVSGGFIFIGRDGCRRDLAGIHGTYRKVAETVPALELIIDFVNSTNPAQVAWLLDRPVSNSGRLKKMMADSLLSQDDNWSIKIVTSPDAELISTDAVVVSNDSIILDGCSRWSNLAAAIIQERIPSAKLIDLSAGDENDSQTRSNK